MDSRHPRRLQRRAELPPGGAPDQAGRAVRADRTGSRDLSEGGGAGLGEEGSVLLSEARRTSFEALSIWDFYFSF